MTSCFQFHLAPLYLGDYADDYVAFQAVGATADVAPPWLTLIGAASMEVELGRGLHSFTSHLNLSAFYGIRGARRGFVARIKGVLGCV